MTAVRGIRCNLCGQFIWSRSVHHFRVCDCGNAWVDGGQTDPVWRYGCFRSNERPQTIEVEVDDATGQEVKQ